VLIGGGTGMIGDRLARIASVRFSRGSRSTRTLRDSVASSSGSSTSIERAPTPPVSSTTQSGCRSWLSGVPARRRQALSVNTMVQKESVRERLHNRDQGISYTEFSYMLLQAYDFLQLRRVEQCTVQMLVRISTATSSRGST